MTDVAELVGVFDGTDSDVILVTTMVVGLSVVTTVVGEGGNGAGVDVVGVVVVIDTAVTVVPTVVGLFVVTVVGVGGSVVTFVETTVLTTVAVVGAPVLGVKCAVHDRFVQHFIRP